MGKRVYCEGHRKVEEGARGPCKRCKGTGVVSHVEIEVPPMDERGDVGTPQGGTPYMREMPCPDCGGKGVGAPGCIFDEVIQAVEGDLTKCRWCGTPQSWRDDKSGRTAWECGSRAGGKREPYQSLQCRVYELEAEVALREARCAVVWGALAAYFSEYDGYYAIPGQVAIFSPSLGLADDMRDAFACADLAAARLLAAGAFRDAYDAYNDHIEDCNACCAFDPCDEGDRLRAKLGDADDAYREAKTAQENADE